MTALAGASGGGVVRVMGRESMPCAAAMALTRASSAVSLKCFSAAHQRCLGWEGVVSSCRGAVPAP